MEEVCNGIRANLNNNDKLKSHKIIPLSKTYVMTMSLTTFECTTTIKIQPNRPDNRFFPEKNKIKIK